MPLDRHLLEQHYLNTHYVLRLGRERITFRIGQHDAAQDQLLRDRCGVQQRWSILTAYNPGSDTADDDVNHLAHARLRRELAAAGLNAYDSVNQSPEGEWLEMGYLIADADNATLRSFARRYRQNAFVEAKIGEAPRLVWMV